MIKNNDELHEVEEKIKSMQSSLQWTRSSLESVRKGEIKTDNANYEETYAVYIAHVEQKISELKKEIRGYSHKDYMIDNIKGCIEYIKGKQKYYTEKTQYKSWTFKNDGYSTYDVHDINAAIGCLDKSGDRRFTKEVKQEMLSIRERVQLGIAKHDSQFVLLKEAERSLEELKSKLSGAIIGR